MSRDFREGAEDAKDYSKKTGKLLFFTVSNLHSLLIWLAPVLTFSPVTTRTSAMIGNNGLQRIFTMVTMATATEEDIGRKMPRHFERYATTNNFASWS